MPGYAGVNAFHPQITMPDDGQPAVVESVNVAFRALQDDAIHFNTELGYKIDSRGGIYNQTGSINIIPAGPVQVQFNILVNQIQLGNGAASTVTVSAGNANVTGSNLNVTSNNTYLTSPVTSIGSGSTQQLNVNSATDVFGFVTLHNDLESGHDISTNTLNVDGGADFNCNAQITHTGQVLTVGGQAVVNNGLVVTGGVTKTRTTQLGQSSTDFHQINGDVTAANDVEIQGTLTVEGAITSNAHGGNSFGDTTIGGALSVLGNTTIGNAANDTLTVNAQLNAPLTGAASSAGRYVERWGGNLPHTDTQVSVLMGNNFTCVTSGFTQNVNYTLDTVQPRFGDKIMIRNGSGGGSFHATVQYGNGGFCTLQNTGDWVEVIWTDNTSSGQWLPWRGNVANT